MSVIRKAVIPAAGLGTRLFPATLEQPKEMLPVFGRGVDGRLVVKPLLQLVFEQLFDFGVREFCFITGRSKRAIEDHFTPDENVVEMLKARGKESVAVELERFFLMIDESVLVWVNQPSPRGFGDAVYRSMRFAKDDNIIVYAGDTYIASAKNMILNRLADSRLRAEAEAVFLVDEVEDPRAYGVIEGELLSEAVYHVKRIAEKPARPASKLAVVAVYLFTPLIFKALEKAKAGSDGEIQLTDAIQLLVDWGFKVMAVRLTREEGRVDIGSPESYWTALNLSHKNII